MTDRDETPVDLPGITLKKWVVDQVNRRRVLQERMTGKPVKFGEVLSNVVEAAIERLTLA